MIEFNKSKTSRAISTVLVVVIVAIIIIAAVAVFASGVLTKSTSTTTTTTAYKSTIIVGTTDAVQTTIDPADAYDYFGDNMINNLGAPLVDFAPGMTNTSPSALQPALATKWSVSSDGLTYTFILRSGLKYDDGTPFNSTDVAYSFNRGMKWPTQKGQSLVSATAAS